MKGTKFGKMVIPGDPMGSNLMWLLDWRGAQETRMPHRKKKLSTCDRDAIRAWIGEGASQCMQKSQHRWLRSDRPVLWLSTAKDLNTNIA